LTCAIAARVLHRERPLELELASRIGRRDYFLQVGLNATWRHGPEGKNIQIEFRFVDGAFPPPAQAVDATQALNLSAGFQIARSHVAVR
jgi:hypothetical protein